MTNIRTGTIRPRAEDVAELVRLRLAESHATDLPHHLHVCLADNNVELSHVLGSLGSAYKAEDWLSVAILAAMASMSELQRRRLAGMYTQMGGA